MRTTLKRPPFFSVVIPLYNKREFIGRALDSVLAQTFRDLEILVVDDGSTDGSGDLVQEKYGFPPVRLVRQKNQGISGARNTGIRRSRSPYLAFLDSDDEYLPGFLEGIRGMIRKFPLAAAYSTACYAQRKFRRKRREYRDIPPGFEGYLPNYFKTAFGTSPVHPSSVVIPRKMFRLAGTFDPLVRNGEDTEMWFRLALRGKIAFLNRPLAVYHRDSGISYADNPNKDYGPYLSSIRKALNGGRLASQDLPWVREYENLTQLKVARTLMVQGRRKEARDLLASLSTKLLARKVLLLWTLTLIPLPLMRLHGIVRKIV